MYGLWDSGSLFVKKTEEKGPFISCVSLSGDETYDVEEPQSLHANKTAEENADYMKTSGKCVDAWVNDEGHCVVRYNKELLENQYNRTVAILQNQMNLSSVRVEVNYECTEVTYYVADGATISDWMGTFMVIGPVCLQMQLFSGVTYENLDVLLKIIYEPTGAEMYNVSLESGVTITEEDWSEKLREMQK
jgi:hypothetical protein